MIAAAFNVASKGAKVLQWAFTTRAGLATTAAVTVLPAAVGQDTVAQLAENAGTTVGYTAAAAGLSAKVGFLHAAGGMLHIGQEAIDALMATVKDAALILFDAARNGGDFSNAMDEIFERYDQNKDEVWQKYVSNGKAVNASTYTAADRKAILEGIEKLEAANNGSLDFEDSKMIRHALQSGDPANVLTNLIEAGNIDGNIFANRIAQNPDYSFSNDMMEQHNAGHYNAGNTAGNVLYSAARGVASNVSFLGGAANGLFQGVSTAVQGGSFRDGWDRGNQRVTDAFNSLMPEGQYETLENVASMVVPGLGVLKVGKLAFSTLSASTKNAGMFTASRFGAPAAAANDVSDLASRNTPQGWGFATP